MNNIVKIIIWLVILVWFSFSFFVTESSKVKIKNVVDGTILENGTKAIVERSVKIGDDVKIYNNKILNFLPSDKQNPYENTDRVLGYGEIGLAIFFKYGLQIFILLFGFINLYNNFRPNSIDLDILANYLN
jgi:hypothetical protein